MLGNLRLEVDVKVTSDLADVAGRWGEAHRFGLLLGDEGVPSSFYTEDLKVILTVFLSLETGDGHFFTIR